jgi:predicted ATPase
VLAEGLSLESTREPSPASASTWEQKPVAVLALEMTWPAVSAGHASPYEPWTAAHRWERIILEKVHGFGGVCLQRSPSLLLVAFGIPQTLEQLPQRAVQAALAVRQLLVQDQRPDGEEPCPTVRLAVHLGQVLVGSGANDPAAQLRPVGEALALPVRLLGQSAPGEIVVSALLGRLVGGWFELESRAGPSGDQLPDQSGTYAVVGLRPQPSPLSMQGPRPSTRFVGRARELAILRDLFAQVEGGQGQVVGIVGEPGVGKSRLLYEFRQQIGAAGDPTPPGDRVRYLEGHCLAYGSALPYLPVLDLLRAQCRMGDTDSAEAISEKVRLTLQTVGMDPEEGMPYLLLLLGVPTGMDRLAMLQPETIKARTFATLRQLFLHSSQRHLLVIAIENLHWIDQTSQDFLASLVEHLAGARIFLLLTYRPGYRPSWIGPSYVTQMVLPPLSSEDSRHMVQAVLQTDTIPDSLVQLMLAKGQGNPFFLEEIVQALIDQGVLVRPDAGGTTGWTPLPTKPLTDIQIPPTVQGVLAARIDRLAPEGKALLQTLAVIGTAIAAPLLTRVVDQPDAELRQRLSHLQAAEFLYERPAGPELEYVFKHVLTQEVAYAALAGERRRVTHARTAQALEVLYAQRLEDHYGELAHHYRHSGHAEKAVFYLQRAGEQAFQRSAYTEAISLLTTGLELLQTLPDTPERRRQELAVQITLGQAFMATKGQVSPEAEHAYTRAYALCQQVGETPQLYEVLAGLRVVYEVRGELAKARELAEEVLSLAQRAQDPGRLARAHASLGLIVFYLGELAPARAHLEQGRALSDSMQDASNALGDQSPGVRCRRIAAWVLWWLGYPDQALQQSHEAISLVQERAHPYSLAFALYFAGILHGLCREGQAAQARAEALIALARQHEFLGMLARGTILRGWALAEQGQPAEGIAQMCQGLMAYQAAGLEVGQPMLLASLAEAYGRMGQATEGLSTLDEALALAHKHEAPYYEAELYRLKGELLLARSAEPHTEAEASFQQALNVARHQQAKSLELRAAMSLARLWQRQGKLAEAHQLLGDIYGWFTEGFDTADLQEARALLEALSG